MKESNMTDILEKLNKLCAIQTYKDYVILSFDAFEKKYGYYGFAFKNFITVRIKENQNFISEVCAFLTDAEYNLLPLITDEEFVLRLTPLEIEEYLKQNKVTDFIIFNSSASWLIVVDKHRNITGIGNYIKKKMSQNLNLQFGDLKVLHVTNDLKKP